MKDVVYSVKPDDNNEELRYSLRSLANVKDFSGRVFIAGYKPRWLKNVTHVYNFQNWRTSKYKNSTTNWYKATTHPDLSQEYIYMNDDFFIMKPVDTIHTYHQGSQQEFIERYLRINSRAYVEGAMTTRSVLKKLGVRSKIKNYELHVPMVFDKDKRKEITLLQREVNPERKNVHTRTLYGNYYKIGGKKMEDVKIHGDGFTFSRDWTFVSTSDESFKGAEVGRWIKSEFPNKSPYEI